MKLNLKIIVFVILVSMLSLMLVGCKGEPKADANSNVQTGLYKPGTYTGEGDGMGGKVKVSVKVDDNNILEVKVLENDETKGIGDAAIDKIPSMIVEGQTLSVDAVTGATLTSNAILTAVEAALKEAGADISKLKTVAEGETVNDDKTYETEVVVVGSGAAGLSAALEAANNGAKVILVEKLAMTGGSTARSGGKIQAAGTDIQKSHGVEDNADLYYNHLMSVGENKVDPVKIRLIADNSLADFNWLVENGVEFSKNIEQLHEKYRPIRGHYVSAQDGKVEQDGHGWAITQPLEKMAKEKGVEILLETPAKKLITDNNGTVTGIECEDAKGNKIIVNAKAVILATGGYDFNKELLEEYAPLVKPVYSTVAPGNVGDGLIMARDAGAKIQSGGGAVLLYLDLAVGVGEVGGLYVDTTGSRFMDETDFWFTRTKKLMDRNQLGMFYITDAKGKSDRFDALVKDGKMVEGSTIEELAGKLGMTELISTVERYNELAKKGVDEDFNKKPEYMKTVDEGPFYAIAFAPITSGTFGGPVTNEKAQVIAEKGGIIKGLYAAGEVANGDIFYQEYPGSGSSISTCVGMGRIAGRVAAEEAKSLR
ncbi:MAG: FAD-dependent oxidoreductase [Sedimentibacter sp.]|nr:FAD-dependent oxidoreductase [Sedimentibacter sp.]